ncbi:MAG TPA: molybdenum cofactor biosynthesis protein MoaE [Rhizomicrobium sp.]|jgi:molybdopterin synthase catalytic subunit|nr:molybdenum cofactor biosynthesis protein MoaE [Rhizomicrobium sp.]
MIGIRIQREDFDVNAEIAALREDGAGAVVTFSGIVRGEADALTLEHYPGMTEREIARHVAAAQSRWPLLGVTVIHRIGRLLPGENIVLVAASSAHRAAAFEACAFLMDYLKTLAPFWKQEERNGQTEWIDARASDDAALKKWR